MREVDPALPVLNLRTQDEQIDRLHAQERLFARLYGFRSVARNFLKSASAAAIVFAGPVILM